LTKRVPPPRLENGRPIDSFKDGHNPLPTAPDIAFIDIGLPGIDGHEVGRRIRAVSAIEPGRVRRPSPEAGQL
jgi:CheY-like chemotaxis protein